MRRDARGKSRGKQGAAQRGHGTRSERNTRGERNTRSERTSRDPRQRTHPRQGHDPRARGAQTRPGSTEDPAREARRLQHEALLKPAAERLALRAPLAPGEWLWTTREAAERDLIEELLLCKAEPRGVAAALVASRRAPSRDEHARLDLTFARQGFPIAVVLEEPELARMAERIAAALAPSLQADYVLQVWVPDSNAGNTLAGRAQALEDALAVQLTAAGATGKRVEDTELRRNVLTLVQVCLYETGRAAAGVLSSDRALSLAPGGRARMRLAGAFPSRAARKLEEAFAWLGMSPGPSESCVDLGAAPGGWSWLLLERRARVIAVDPARMDPALARDRRLTHVQGDAFKYAPDEPVDWLFCDMAWRPLEVAQMLGRWARKRHTRMLVANFKLPMKRKAEMVQELRATLEAAGFTGLRTRQLYHDREEITLTARVR